MNETNLNLLKTVINDILVIEGVDEQLAIRLNSVYERISEILGSDVELPEDYS